MVILIAAIITILSYLLLSSAEKLYTNFSHAPVAVVVTVASLKLSEFEESSIFNNTFWPGAAEWTSIEMASWPAGKTIFSFKLKKKPAHGSIPASSSIFNTFEELFTVPGLGLST